MSRNLVKIVPHVSPRGLRSESQTLQTELTDRTIRAIEIPEMGRKDISDKKRPGLRLRVSSTGKKTWMFEKRVKGAGKMKATLGDWPDVSLAEARRRGQELAVEANQGIDRMAANKLERQEAERRARETQSLAEVLAVYEGSHLSTLKDGSERLRQLKAAFRSKMSRPVTELSTADCQKAIDEKTQAGKNVMANRVRSAICHFTKWCSLRGNLPEDIAKSIPRAAREDSRDVVLSVAEMRELYAAASKLAEPWASAVKLLILTGQRRGEILKLRWEEVDLNARTLTKPGSRTKNARSHVTHLAPTAVAILQGLADRRTSGCEWVITTTDVGPVDGLSKIKPKLVAMLGDTFPKDWNFHDFRTAMATALCDAGFSEAVVDRIQNHAATGSAPSAVSRVYQRSEMLTQRAEALEAWEALVNSEP